MTYKIPQVNKEKFYCDVYQDFYKRNEELFERNPVEYWRQAGQEKRHKLREYERTGINPYKNKEAPKPGGLFKRIIGKG